MSAGNKASADAERVVVLAPIGRDAALVCQVLALHDVHAVACGDMHELVEKLRASAGAALLTEEALSPQGVPELVAALRAQPPWSDLPVLALVGRDPLGQATSKALHALLSAGNLMVLQRPLMGLSLATAVQSALRARRRQYDQRDLVQSERTARREAQDALRTRDEFLATISHELRTPLNAIVLWTHLLEREHTDARVLQQGFPALSSSAEALSRLIEDLLDMSRVISGTLRIRMQAAELDQIARTAAEVVRPVAREKDIQLEAKLESGSVLRADPDRLQQVLWNLLSNSIKFTPRGGRVSIRSLRSDAIARIEVADTGKGIDPQFLPHVFEHFRQAETTTKRLEGGLGLGLAISRQLVELHGGTIRAQSPGLGRGAVFTVELPLSSNATPRAVKRVQSSAPADAGALRALEGVRVLLVEDDRNAREAIAAVLESRGARVFGADRAEAALKILAAVTEAGDAPHVLIADLGLPAVDGYELLHRIRGMEQAHGTPALPAVSITGYVSSPHPELAVAAGFHAHLPKPIDPERLVSVVDELAHVRVNEG